MPAKRKIREVDYIANLKEVNRLFDPEGTVVLELIKEMLYKSGPNRLLAFLSSDQRKAMLRRLQEMDTSKPPAKRKTP